jgi:hypothetical protein
LPSDDPYPEFPPDVPLRGSPSAPLKDLLCWHSEIHTSLYERSIAIADHKRAVAAYDLAVANKNAGIDALQAAVDAAEAHQRITLSRLTDADRRRSTAWQAYVSLYDKGAASPFAKGDASDDEDDVLLELEADDAGAEMDHS